MDDPNNSFSLNTNPSAPTPPQPPSEPLNTGNGLANSAEPHEITPGNLEVNAATIAPVAAPSAPVIAEAPVMTPEPKVMPDGPVMEIPKAPEMPMSSADAMTPAPENNFKKYIIIAAVGLLILGGALAYFFYFADSGETDTKTEETDEDSTGLNKLSGDDASTSPEMEELEDVVEDLKDVYSEDSSSTAPPSITIDLSEESSPEPESEPAPKKIAR